MSFGDLRTSSACTPLFMPDKTFPFCEVIAVSEIIANYLHRALLMLAWHISLFCFLTYVYLNLFLLTICNRHFLNLNLTIHVLIRVFIPLQFKVTIDPAGLISTIFVTTSYTLLIFLFSLFPLLFLIKHLMIVYSLLQHSMLSHVDPWTIACSSVRDLGKNTFESRCSHSLQESL